MRDKNENFERKVCKKKKRKKMKIYINHSFLFNIDSMLRCFSSEIDQMWSGEIDQMWSKCGEYKQLFIL